MCPSWIESTLLLEEVVTRNNYMYLCRGWMVCYQMGCQTPHIYIYIYTIIYIYIHKIHTSIKTSILWQQLQLFHVNRRYLVVFHREFCSGGDSCDCSTSASRCFKCVICKLEWICIYVKLSSLYDISIHF